MRNPAKCRHPYVNVLLFLTTKHDVRRESKEEEKQKREEEEVGRFLFHGNASDRCCISTALEMLCCALLLSFRVLFSFSRKEEDRCKSRVARLTIGGGFASSVSNEQWARLSRYLSPARVVTQKIFPRKE